jgi:hypothetical protein
MRQKAGSAPVLSQGTNPVKPLRPAWPEGPPPAPTAADQPGRLCVRRHGSAPAPSKGRNPVKPLCSAWPERALPRPPLPWIIPGGFASGGTAALPPRRRGETRRSPSALHGLRALPGPHCSGSAREAMCWKARQRSRPIEGDKPGEAPLARRACKEPSHAHHAANQPWEAMHTRHGSAPKE